MNSDFDERLDEALQKYGAAEPRDGLESRILANLAAEAEHATVRGWHWGWIAAPVAIGLVAVVLISILLKPHSGDVKVAKQVSVTTKIIQERKPPAAPDQKILSVERARRHQKLAHPVAIAGTEPRLEQFPSPTPLNEQEQMLARYVRERRQEAVVVARARAELLKTEMARFQSVKGTTEDDF